MRGRQRAPYSRPQPHAAIAAPSAQPSGLWPDLVLELLLSAVSEATLIRPAEILQPPPPGEEGRTRCLGHLASRGLPGRPTPPRYPLSEFLKRVRTRPTHCRVALYRLSKESQADLYFILSKQEIGKIHVSYASPTPFKIQIKETAKRAELGATTAPDSKE